jgi:glycosyltransferase involved in cell wall biosynthesis
LQKRLRHLLLATLEDPYDPRSWSGTPYHIRLALQAKIERVSIIAKLKPRRTVSNAVLRVILGGTPPRYPLYLTPAAQRQFAAQTLHAIHEYRPDAVLAISSHNLVAMGVPPVPTFMVTDAPWLAWKETYQDYETLPLLGRRFARLEAQAAQRCTGLIFSSEWACAEAVRLYGVPRHKLHSIPLGASWTPDVATERLLEIIAARPDDKLDLLFVGKDWERKGGPLAIEIARHLKLRGVSKVRLHIVGCRPPLPADAAEFIECHGFLNAKMPQEAALLKKLFYESHFLLVPTRAECFGLVFAEAQAFGLPPISRAVQALPSIIADGETGILQPDGATAADYVVRILQIIGDRERYRAMASAAHARFRARLSWESFAERVIETIERS